MFPVITVRDATVYTEKFTDVCQRHKRAKVGAITSPCKIIWNTMFPFLKVYTVHIVKLGHV